MDIQAAVVYAGQLGSRIILQGHSFGCQKVLYYLTKTASGLDFAILRLAWNTYQLQANYLQGGDVSEQLARIESTYAGRMNTMLPPEEFGILGKGVGYPIPITAQSLIWTFTSDVIKLLKYREPPDYFIDAVAFVYYGQSDGLWTEDAEFVKAFFSRIV